MTVEGMPLSVLLVEDDLDGRRLYAEWLTGAGFHVQEAHNGLQALERAFDARPDVVVTDLHIPGIDGFELTRRLKQDPRTQDIPVAGCHGLRHVCVRSGARASCGLRCDAAEAVFAGGPRGCDSQPDRGAVEAVKHTR